VEVDRHTELGDLLAERRVLWLIEIPSHLIARGVGVAVDECPFGPQLHHRSFEFVGGGLGILQSNAGEEGKSIWVGLDEGPVNGFVFALAEETATSGSIMPWIPGEVIERIVKAIPFSSISSIRLPTSRSRSSTQLMYFFAVAGRFPGVIP
jgi:hypothetical protein